MSYDSGFAVITAGGVPGTVHVRESIGDPTGS